MEILPLTTETEALVTNHVTPYLMVTICHVYRNQWPVPRLEDLASFARVPDVIVLKDDSHAFTSILDLEVLEEITLERDLKA